MVPLNKVSSRTTLVEMYIASLNSYMHRSFESWGVTSLPAISIGSAYDVNCLCPATIVSWRPVDILVLFSYGLVGLNSFQPQAGPTRSQCDRSHNPCGRRQGIRCRKYRQGTLSIYAN